MTAHAIEIEGLRKVYRAPAGSRHASPSTASTWPFPRAACSASSGRTARARRRPSAACSASSGPLPDPWLCSARRVPDDLPSVIDRVGAIVETPALFPTMTGRRNLELLAPLAGRDRREVRAVLERVGLADRATTSCGATASACASASASPPRCSKDPALLVLDEPANGLDPAGIREVRFLLRELAAEGRTVLVSSHQLRRGRPDLRPPRHPASRPLRRDRFGGRAAGPRRPAVDARASRRPGRRRSQAHRGRLRGRRWPAAPSTSTLSPSEDRTSPAPSLRRGHWVAELTPVAASLEDLFLDLTADDPGTDASVEVAA